MRRKMREEPKEKGNCTKQVKKSRDINYYSQTK